MILLLIIVRIRNSIKRSFKEAKVLEMGIKSFLVKVAKKIGYVGSTTS